LDIKKEYIYLIDDTIQYIRTGFRRKQLIECSGDPSDISSLKTGHKKTDSRPGDNFKEISRMERSSKDGLMREIEKQVKECQSCRLYAGRKMAVAGEGKPDADILLIGEGPGAREDATGRPFVGRAGQLLTRMLASINLKREEVYITNIVKCRPPGNRDPLPDEVQTCLPYLERQIEIIQPIIIVCLGLPAIKTLTGAKQGISRLRGTFQQYRGYPVLPTYHPAAVLRFPEKYKRPVWNDLKMLRDYYRDVKK